MPSFRFIGSSGTFTCGQEQIDLHLLSDHNSPTFPKFRLVHRQLTLTWGLLYCEVLVNANAPWVLVPGIPPPLTLRIRMPGGQLVVMPLQMMPNLQGAWGWGPWGWGWRLVDIKAAIFAGVLRFKTTTRWVDEEHCWVLKGTGKNK
ncbi:hypothetical protein ARMGADRAFT_1033814 [Armillaria gallica]|uniref:Uncharacterized protein n=1 Tax=Armillaria gallica TaxID=47427 RepID=A0A2H3DID3_ARMGA|nr:hypothetical protein ARMGADRAFT_1033814 [Armillaria gallica]